MAEAVVAAITYNLVELQLEEAKLFKGVQKRVESLKNELESIKCFLEDAEARSRKGGDTNDGVKIWVKQVRDEANHIEDLIDEYLSDVAPCRHKSRFVGFLKIGRIVKHLMACYHVASEIQDIKASVQEIRERTFHFSDASTSIFQENDVNQLSFSSGRFSFFSDDIED